MENLRNNTWICCLSKVYDSLLMWAYYNSHKGICIGLNMEAVLKCCQYKFFGLTFPYAAEVKYKNIHTKLDYFKDHPSWEDLLTTKAKEWEHEQEYRLLRRCPLASREDYLFLGHALKYVILSSKLRNTDEVLYFKNATATISSFTKPPKTFTF